MHRLSRRRSNYARRIDCAGTKHNDDELVLRCRGSLAGPGFALEATITMAAIVLTHLVLRPVGFRLGRLPLVAVGKIRHVMQKLVPAFLG